MEVAGDPFPVVDEGERLAHVLQLFVGGAPLGDVADDRDHEQPAVGAQAGSG